MMRAYSQRLLPPYSGVVQIAEIKSARAQSFDGYTWEFQFLPPTAQSQGDFNRAQGYALDRSYHPIAKLQGDKLTPYIKPAFLDAAEVDACIEQLSSFLSTAQVPFPGADIYEYWLLDGLDQSPLAMIYSCCEEGQMSNFPKRSEWTALPHSKMKVDNTDGEQARGEAPVNHRFERLVAKRAGNNPQGAWFTRSYTENEGFPGVLVREDWQHEADRDLCQRYLQRKAPRLLMLQGLSTEERSRMEIASKKHALEVDEYYPLFPDVIDSKLMSALRVEARLRRNGPQQAKTPVKDSKPTVRPMSKDMRIFET